MRFSALLGALAAFVCFSAAASATIIGAPVDGALGFQPSATPIMDQIYEFHGILLVIITAISLFVLGLIIWVIARYREKSHPEPKKFSHNTTVEVVWTLVPVLILVLIAIPSFRLLYAQDVIPEADFTIKTTGNQWNWTYEYPDHGGFEFVSNMVEAEDIAGHPFAALRNLTTDVPVVVPVDAVVRVQVTASDVIHSWAVPSFGVKMDGIPGRLNETWFQATREGIYFGQCSEICGLRHAFMPIEVHVVPQEVFDAWVEASQDDPYEAPQVLAAYYDSVRADAQLASAR
ncbi:cytochrome c oxidase subunit II [Alkalicaulis satelles]|uniref:Cytochrome c oxidase subunit 2 n=1 Tax=Alkalicaulis satelles TaxID=2609175 RepID=A0A5M6ZCI5_9PROT|nr:cytochrome c oxidase subunit II [Alkalicaulis satelles]KAA5801614.1 cytochrome c oxidase subunit II [Alkalicaulis satelles]